MSGTGVVYGGTPPGAIVQGTYPDHRQRVIMPLSAPLVQNSTHVGRYRSYTLNTDFARRSFCYSAPCTFYLQTSNQFNFKSRLITVFIPPHRLLSQCLSIRSFSHEYYLHIEIWRWSTSWGSSSTFTVLWPGEGFLFKIYGTFHVFVVSPLCDLSLWICWP